MSTATTTSMVGAATTGGASLKKLISQYSPLIDYSAPLLQQTPDPSASATNQITLQQQQQLLTQVRHHRSTGVNLSQTTQATATSSLTIQPQASSSALSTITTNNHMSGGHHNLQQNPGQTNNINNNNSNSSSTSSNNSTTVNECSNNFMNSVVHELNAIKLISNNSASGASGLGQGHHHLSNQNLNINCRPSNTDNNGLLFGLNHGGMSVGVGGVGDSNNSISILSNKPHNNLWGQLPSANGNNTNPTTNTNSLLYNQTATNNISNLWGCSSSSSSSSVISNANINVNNNQCNNINNNNNPGSSHPSLSPISSSSVRSSQYHSAGSHRSNSKESLWTSSQSSPNSNLRDSFYSIKSNSSPTSSTTSSAGSTCSSNGGCSGGGTGTTLSQSTSLWESPLLGPTKLSIDAATSYASQLNKISNIWEIPNPAANICNPKSQHQQQQQQQQPSQQRNGNCMNSSFLGQSRDLIFNDLWSNTDSCSTTLNSSDHHQHQQQHRNQSHQFNAGVGSDSKHQSDAIGSIWRTTPATTTAAAAAIGGGVASIQQHHNNIAAIRNNKTNCSTMKTQQRPVVGANASFFTNGTDSTALSAATTTASLPAAAAAAASSSSSSGSSSCMQLFSEEFLNYLNMIN